MRCAASLAAVAALLAACSATAPVAPQRLATEAAIREPLSAASSEFLVEIELAEELAFFGQPPPEASVKNGYGGPLYPGDSAAVFFAAIMTHSMMSQGVQAAEEKKRIEAANAILEPYLPTIGEIPPDYVRDYAIGQAALNQRATIRRFDEAESARGWHTKIHPVFIMSHTQDAISIRADVAIAPTDAMDAPPVYARTVHLHSAPVADHSVWLADSGRALRSAVYDLSRDALMLAIDDFQGKYDTADIEHTTIRYLENGVKTVERGKILEQQCETLVFESLRSELKRVQSLESC